MADVLVTNDSGPGHFSSMTDITSIVLFGPETPDVFGPLGPHTHVVRSNLACSPCVNVYNHRFSPCTNNVCMQQIEVDEVYQTGRRPPVATHATKTDRHAGCGRRAARTPEVMR